VPPNPALAEVMSHRWAHCKFRLHARAGDRRICFVMQSLILALILMSPMQVAPSRTMDESVPPSNNYDKAEFRLWLPEGPASVRAII
jgi:hypothetical protein